MYTQGGRVVAKQYSVVCISVLLRHYTAPCVYVILTDSSFAPSHTAGVRGGGGGAQHFANIMKIFFSIA